jgi:hypothetical protein
MDSLIPAEMIERKIILIRGQKVMLDADLAKLYGVSTKRLNEQVRRNANRFPPDFMFQLNEEETELLRSQIATSKATRGGRRYLPYVFSEQGERITSNRQYPCLEDSPHPGAGSFNFWSRKSRPVMEKE